MFCRTGMIELRRRAQLGLLLVQPLKWIELVRGQGNQVVIMCLPIKDDN